jgi:ribosome-associated heat shock protein Hsp15
MDILQLQRLNGFIDRAKGTGRPTKKDRRDLDEYTQPEYVDEFDFDLDDLDDEEVAENLPRVQL